MVRNYTASKTRTKGGTSWVISFRHPLRKDARGKQGRKIRRGLGTPSEVRAQELVDQMNHLLGDVTWHNVAKRSEAERRFDPIVVRGFYDGIDAPFTNSLDIRNQFLPLPTVDDGYAQVLMVGTTGAGKTSLLRQIIGSHPKRDRFPSTSASRTTISDIEVIPCDESQFRAVVTFFSESTVHTHIHECIGDACATLWNPAPDDKLAEKLLTHRDLRFRLGYIIGTWKQSRQLESKTDDWGYDEDGDELSEPSLEEESSLPSQTEIVKMRLRIRSFLERIRTLADEAKALLQSQLEIEISALKGTEHEAAQDLYEEIVQSLPDFDDLVNDIMDEVSLRFDRINSGEVQTRRNGWPVSWKYETNARDEFIREVRRFSSNYAPAFGTLLTPLVDGIRIRGPLLPRFADSHPKLVLLDGEGLGHVSDPAAGVASRIARRFADVDVILLVDSAKGPMLEAPVSILRAVAASGFQKKLAFGFTHFDLIRGQANLPNFRAQRAHVLSAVRQTLTGLREFVGVSAVRAIERELDARCFMLGYLDRPLTQRQRGPVKEIMELIDFCESAIHPTVVSSGCPVYDTAGLVLAIQAATTEFNARWNAILFTGSSYVRKAHWAEIKALNRRIVLDMDGGEYKHLTPVADLVARLSEAITMFLEKPVQWIPPAISEKASDEAFSRVQQSVFSRLHEFAEAKLIHEQRSRWVKAFEFRGPGSTYDRANVIRNIYRRSAPIPGPALTANSEEFLRTVRRLLHDAIEEGGGKLVSDILR